MSAVFNTFVQSPLHSAFVDFELCCQTYSHLREKQLLQTVVKVVNDFFLTQLRPPKGFRLVFDISQFLIYTVFG